MTTTWLILARAVHIGACLLFFGMFTFDRLVATAIFKTGKTETGDFWHARIRLFSLVLLPVILLSGILWFGLVAMTMSGSPLQWDILKIVWVQTQFGTVWKLRLYLWLAASVFAALYRPQTEPSQKMTWVQLLLSGGLLGSLAWAGHGQESSSWHLYADILHLLVAGLWPAGLLPFVLLLQHLRRSSEPMRSNFIAVLVRRFSALSLGSVSLLTITGLVNGWFLVGSPSNLFQQTYGRWLIAKFILFCVIISIGAINLLRLKPRIMREKPGSHESGTAAAQLQFNVRAELFLGILIVILVAVLGILPPANH
jgi:putative copper resistance protein D